MKIFRYIIASFSLVVVLGTALWSMAPGGLAGQNERELISKMNKLDQEMKTKKEKIEELRARPVLADNPELKSTESELNDLLTQAQTLYNRQTEFRAQSDDSKKRLEEFKKLYDETSLAYGEARGEGELNAALEELDQIIQNDDMKKGNINTPILKFVRNVLPAIENANRAIGAFVVHGAGRAPGEAGQRDIAADYFSDLLNEKKRILEKQVTDFTLGKKADFVTVINKINTLTAEPDRTLIGNIKQVVIDTLNESQIELLKEYAKEVQNLLDKRILEVAQPNQNFINEFNRILDGIKNFTGTNAQATIDLGSLRVINREINDTLLKQILLQENRGRYNWLMQWIKYINEKLEEYTLNFYDLRKSKDNGEIYFNGYMTTVNTIFSIKMQKLTSFQESLFYNLIFNLFKATNLYTTIITNLNFETRESNDLEKDRSLLLKETPDDIQTTGLIDLISQTKDLLKQLQPLPNDANQLIKDIYAGIDKIVTEQFIGQEVAAGGGWLHSIKNYLSQTLGTAQARILYSLQAILNPSFTPAGWENLKIKQKAE